MFLWQSLGWFPSTSFMRIFNLCIKKPEWNAEISPKAFMLHWGGKVGLLLKAKCDKVQWKQTWRRNHDLNWSVWLKDPLKPPLHWRDKKAAADGNIRSVWSDEETVTFLKSIHETNINVIFSSFFLHWFSPFEVVPSLLHFFCFIGTQLENWKKQTGATAATASVLLYILLPQLGGQHM